MRLLGFQSEVAWFPICFELDALVSFGDFELFILMKIAEQ